VILLRGLGKTLQAISLIYTAIKQGYLTCAFCLSCRRYSLLIAHKHTHTHTHTHTCFRPHGAPISRRAIIVTPSSLAENWEKEFKRWLGIRINPIVAGGARTGAEVEKLLQLFSITTSREVLIISYGYFRKFQEQIYKIPCDLVVCDEAHKVKNSSSQIAAAVAQLPTKRRILLTGTPIQVLCH
jgi:SNF2 family DNA or RNA helicase